MTTKYSSDGIRTALNTSIHQLQRRSKSQQRKHITSTPIAISYKQLAQQKMEYIRTLHQETALLEKQLNEYRYIRIYPSRARERAIEGYQRLINCNLTLIEEEFYKLEKMNEMRRENHDNNERVVVYSEDPWKINENKENSAEKETMISHHESPQARQQKGKFKAEQMQKKSGIRDQNPFDFSGFDFDIEESEIHECPNDSFDDSLLALEQSTPTKKKKRKKAKKIKDPLQFDPDYVLASISQQQLLRPLIEPLQIVPKLDPPKIIQPGCKLISSNPENSKYKELVSSLQFSSQLHTQESVKKGFKQGLKDLQSGSLKYQDFFRKKSSKWRAKC